MQATRRLEGSRLQGSKARGSKCRLEGSRLEGSRLEVQARGLEARRLEARRLEARSAGSRAQGSKARGSKARRLETLRIRARTMKWLPTDTRPNFAKRFKTTLNDTGVIFSIWNKAIDLSFHWIKIKMRLSQSSQIHFRPTFSATFD